MAFSHGNIHSDTAKKEQIITEFFAKSLHIILESRTPYGSSHNYIGDQVLSSPSSSSSSSSSHRSRDKWFNLALRECPAALEKIDFWRQSNVDPMVVDIVLVQRSVNHEPGKFSAKKDVVRNQGLKEQDPNHMNLEKEDFQSEKIIERWVVQYVIRKASKNGNATKRSGGNLHTLYKKSILLLRSLYATVRLLPAYKLFRELISSGQIRTYTLTHRVHSFVEPFTRKEEADMQKFSFNPVDISCGQLCISALYHTSVSDINTEPSTPMPPHFIPDYVGSPFVDPLKRFPSLPVSQSSPAYSLISKQHSWSSTRLSIQDDFDDSEFACHFVVDDNDMMDPSSRPVSSEPRRQPSEPFESDRFATLKKSQDAAVGALVLMLKKAPSLHHNRINSIASTSSTVSKRDRIHEQDQGSVKAATYSSIFSSKTTAEVLAEITSYKEMKEKLLQDGASLKEESS